MKGVKKIVQIIKWIFFIFLGVSLIWVTLYRFVNPPATPLMFYRYLEKRNEGKDFHIRKKWMPVEKISPHLIQAVVAAEDNRFLEHYGIDVEAIEKAIEHNKKSKRKHGASTISQQTARNLFLWPSRTFVRKGFELYFTGLIELTWSKKRIMEVYLNIIETGDGIFGAEAAAQKYFKKPSSRLSKEEAALIAISLPNPRKRNPARPTTYMLQRGEVILDLMDKIEPVRFD